MAQIGSAKRKDMAGRPGSSSVSYTVNRRQVMAEKNLHMMLHQSELECKRALESRHQYELAYRREATKYATLLKQHMSVVAQQPSLRKSSTTQPHLKPAGTQTEFVEATRTSSSRLASPDDLEEDGACAVRPAANKVPQLKPVSKVNELKESDTESIATTDSGLFSGDHSLSSTLQSGQQRSSTSSGLASVTDVRSVHTKSSVKPQPPTQPAQQNENKRLQGLVSPPGISQSLFDKIVNENLRLRRVLEDVLHNKGLTIQSFLDSCQYEDTIKSMRTTLNQQREEIERLKEELQADPNSQAQKCQQLETALNKSNAALVGRQALLETLHKEYEKLLKWKQQQEKTKDGDDASTPAQCDKEETDGTLIALQTQLKELEKRLEESRRENVQLIQRLEKETKKVSELLTEQKKFASSDKLKEENRKMKAQIAEMETELELLRQQLHIFKDDFASERKEKEEAIKRHEILIQKKDDKITDLNAKLKTIQLKNENPVDPKNMAQFYSQLSSPARFGFQKGMPQVGLVADCPGESEPLSTDSVYASCISEPSEKTLLAETVAKKGQIQGAEELSCDKCLKPFKPGQKDALARHRARCIDDD